MTAGRGPPDAEGMEHPTRLPETGPIRALAVLSGVVGVLAGLFLIGFFTLTSYGVRLAGVSLGTINDVLGAIQFATLAPVAWGLGRRLPATRIVRAATGTALIAMAGYVVLSVLLVAGVLTFEQQIGPVVATIIAVYAWLLTVNLVGHRTRTLPRAVTRAGVLLAGVCSPAWCWSGPATSCPGSAVGWRPGWATASGESAGSGCRSTPCCSRPGCSAAPPSLLPADHNDHITEGISS